MVERIIFCSGYGEEKSPWVSGCNPVSLSAFVDRLFSVLEFLMVPSAIFFLLPLTIFHGGKRTGT